MDEYYDEHISSVRDGYVVALKQRMGLWIKACSPIDGIGTVVNVRTGTFFFISQLHEPWCHVMFESVYDIY